jgi:hypothetical protein
MVFKWFRGFLASFRRKSIKGQEFQNEIDILKTHMLLVYRSLADKQSQTPAQIVSMPTEPVSTRWMVATLGTLCKTLFAQVLRRRRFSQLDCGIKSRIP